MENEARKSAWVGRPLQTQQPSLLSGIGCKPSRIEVLPEFGQPDGALGKNCATPRIAASGYQYSVGHLELMRSVVAGRYKWTVIASKYLVGGCECNRGVAGGS